MTIRFICFFSVQRPNKRKFLKNLWAFSKRRTDGSKILTQRNNSVCVSDDVPLLSVRLALPIPPTTDGRKRATGGEGSAEFITEKAYLASECRRSYGVLGIFHTNSCFECVIRTFRGVVCCVRTTLTPAALPLPPTVHRPEDDRVIDGWVVRGFCHFSHSLANNRSKLELL